jgi:cell fate regulator YaaT (PSP1 superfamily)
MRKVGRSRTIKEEILCSSCGSYHMVKDRELKERQRKKCINYEYHFYLNTKHTYPKRNREPTINSNTNKEFSDIEVVIC